MVTNESYHGWDAWRIENGPLALILVPQVGGRIMGLQWPGQELPFVNSACEGRIEPPGLLEEKKRHCQSKLA